MFRTLVMSFLLGSATSIWSAPGMSLAEGKKWWSFQSVQAPPVPQSLQNKAWVRQPVDAFVLQRLEAAGLAPTHEASKEELIRRVTLDLWGFPPTPEALAEFLSDVSPDAYERLVDRLLASHHYGERWARHWLDLVRYADSDGYKADDFRPDAWRYRDYVVRSFNADKSYALFISEQIAGDELAPEDPDALIATGYLRHGIYEYNNRDVAGQRTTILNDITDTTADVFLGLGLQCARCHDHKFDPLLQKDYYRLQAYFAPLLPVDGAVVAGKKEREEYQRKQTAWETATAEIREKIAALEVKYRSYAEKDAIAKFPEETQVLMQLPAKDRTPLEEQLYYYAFQQVIYEYDRLETKIKGTDKEMLVQLRKALAAFDSIKPAPLPVAATARDVSGIAPAVFIPKQESLGDILPGIPSLLEVSPAIIHAPHAATTGRRSALAKWLAAPENPLTARVMVNRVWHWHFGRGLSSTTSDFGKLGEIPTHPELLDWLSDRFVKDQWSLKKLHRLLVTSATYRQSSQSTLAELAQVKDPENRLFWRWSTQRMAAEQIRDSLLAATGELDLATGGPSVDYTKPRRTIYNKVLRNVRDPLLDVFDAPQHFNSTATRDTTTTALQSLLLVNHRPFLERAEAMAERLEKQFPLQPAEQIRLAYQLLYQRSPTSHELAEAMEFLREQSIKIPHANPNAANFLAEAMPQREGKAAVLAPGSAQEKLVLFQPMPRPTADFTIETVVLLRSVYEDGSLRVIASSWDGGKEQSGWSLGITGTKSQRKPRMLTLQMVGHGTEGEWLYEPVFSDLQIQLDRSYYLAASVHLGGPGEGTVTFYLKDLANDDEPLQTTVVPHPLVKNVAGNLPIVIGGRTGKESGHQWDGLIDEVRLRQGTLSPDQCFFQHPKEKLPPAVTACWQFEPATGYFHDMAQRLDNLQCETQGKSPPRHGSALADLCHAMLNSNEFLYIK
jgi:hypothetical protein